MKIVTRMIEEELYESSTADGIKATIDMRPLPLKQSQSPVEILLSSVAACGAVDIVVMLRKRKKTILDFTIETEQIVEVGKKFGMIPRIHANQLNRSGGVQVGVKTGAISVDHLENMGDEEIAVLKNSSTMPTALPGAAFFLGLPFPPARNIISAGLPLAIASDFNPGSAPSGNMPLMIALACIKMKLTPEEAVNAATINTAYTLHQSDELGSITKGKRANVFITKPMPSVAFLPYAFGTPMVERVILNGRIIGSSQEQ